MDFTTGGTALGLRLQAVVEVVPVLATVNIYSTDGVKCTSTISLAPTELDLFLLPYRGFTGNCNLQKVGAVELVAEVTTSNDPATFALRLFRTYSDVNLSPSLTSSPSVGAVAPPSRSSTPFPTPSPIYDGPAPSPSAFLNRGLRVNSNQGGSLRIAETSITFPFGIFPDNTFVQAIEIPMDRSGLPESLAAVPLASTLVYLSANDTRSGKTRFPAVPLTWCFRLSGSAANLPLKDLCIARINRDQDLWQCESSKLLNSPSGLKCGDGGNANTYFAIVPKVNALPPYPLPEYNHGYGYFNYNPFGNKGSAVLTGSAVATGSNVAVSASAPLLPVVPVVVALTMVTLLLF